MRSILVVDGHSPSDAGEGELVCTLASRCRKFQSVRYTNNFRAAYEQRWDIIWFTGHVTLYTKVNRTASLERLENGKYVRLLTHADVGGLPTRLLVLNSCNTSDVSLRTSTTQETVVGHHGDLGINVSLGFASLFMSSLCEYLRRDRLEAKAVDAAWLWTKGLLCSKHTRWKGRREIT